MLLSPRLLLSFLFISFCPCFSHARCLRGGEGCFRLFSLGCRSLQGEKAGICYEEWGQTQTQTQTTQATDIYHEDRHRVGGGQRGEERPTTNSCTSGAKNVNGPRLGAKKEKIIPWTVCTYCFCESERHWPDGDEPWFVQLGQFARFCLNWGTMKSETDDKWFLE